MIGEAETGLIELIRTSALGPRLREVDSLPDVSGEALVKRFGTAAPAVYLVAGDLQVRDRAARLRFGAVCVARNARSTTAARQGDGVGPIGLYDLLITVAGLVDGASVGGASWQVASVDFLSDETIYRAGLQAGVVRIETSGAVDLPYPADESTMDRFITFHSDLDIPPHETEAEHRKWLQDPPDKEASQPDAEDQVRLGP